MWWRRSLPSENLKPPSVWYQWQESNAFVMRSYISEITFYFHSFRYLSKIAESDCQLRHVCLHVWPSPTRRCHEIWYWIFFEILLRMFKFRYNEARIAGTLHEDALTFIIISFSILLRVRNILDIIVERIKTYTGLFISPWNI